MSKSAFGVFNTMAGETIANIWMDIELVKDETIVNPETLSLSPIANGSVYTLLPLDDCRVTSLKDLKTAYINFTEKPTDFFSTSIGRIDNLIKAVRGIFKDTEYIYVKCKDDLNAIINPRDGYEFEIVKISTLGNLLKEIEEDKID